MPVSVTFPYHVEDVDETECLALPRGKVHWLLNCAYEHKRKQLAGRGTNFDFYAINSIQKRLLQGLGDAVNSDLLEWTYYSWVTSGEEVTEEMVDVIYELFENEQAEASL